MAEIADFKINLQTSSYLEMRQNLLANHQAPKLSQANQNLGEDLANLVFQHCDEALKEDFGLTRPLKGPGNDLWVSPSDLLVGKLALKPPFTPKCLQALTHRGILEIGYDLENKFKQEMETDKQKCLEAYKEELLSSVEARIRSEIKDAEIHEKLNCHMELEKQAREYEINLKNELDLLEQKLQAEYEELLQKQESNLQDDWNKVLKEEVDQTVEQITQEFLIQLDEQEEILTKNFSLELKKREALRDFDAKMNDQKTRRALRQLKHNLQCTSLVNMMFILCSERQKCCQEKEKIENYYKNEIKKLQDIMQKKDDELLKLEQIQIQKTKDIEIRETILNEILKQFQKFINFALKSAPTQAEFLLSVEKMMVFELTNAISNKEFISLTNENAILTWKHSDMKSSITSDESSLRIKDFHDCYNERDPPKKATTESDNDLPVIYFEERRYLREEFKHIPSDEVQAPPDSNLWNKDVEILIDNWRKEHQSKNKLSEEGLLLKEREEHEKRGSFDKKESAHSAKGEPKSLRDSGQRERSTVQFKTVTGGTGASRMESKPAEIVVDGDIDREHHTHIESKAHTERKSFVGTCNGRKLSFRRSSLKPIPISKLIPDVQFDEEHANGSRSNLLAARDSFELIREKSKSRNSVPMAVITKDSEEEVLLVEIIDEDTGEKKEKEDDKLNTSEKEVEDDKLKTLLKKDDDGLTKQSMVSEEIVLDRPHLKDSGKEEELVMETRDSIILQKVSLMKKSSTADFHASPVDSVELTKELRQQSVEGIRSKSSKLTSARNSVTLLRESMAKLGEPSPVCIKRNKTLESSQSLSLPLSPCCEKCKKRASILEDTTSHSERSVKISHIQVIDIDKNDTNIAKRTTSSVSFQRQATVYEPVEDPSNTQESATLKKQTRKVSNAKKQPIKPQSYYDAYSVPKIQILGNQDSPEGTESVHEFTKNRIRSLINLMKDEPFLMHLFTSCRR